MKRRKVPLVKMKGIYNRDKVEAMGDKTALFYSIRCTLLVNWPSSLPRTHVERIGPRQGRNGTSSATCTNPSFCVV